VADGDKKPISIDSFFPGGEKMASEFSDQYLTDLISQVLGDNLLEREVRNCLAGVEILSPPVAREFWQTDSGQKGIYLVLAGKVRLLDGLDNLIATLNDGATFGEMSLFPQEELIPYVARASTGLKLAYLGGDVLVPLINKYPALGDRLQKRTEIWDLVIRCKENIPQLQASGANGLLQALSLCDRHRLNLGPLNSEISKNSQILFLQSGLLQDSGGKQLGAGNIYKGNKKINNWQVAQPTILYKLKTDDWQTACGHCPQLAFLIDPNAQINSSDIEKPRKTREFPDKTRKVIPFPQTQKSPEKQPKKHRPYFPSPKVAIGQTWGNLTQKFPYFAQQSATDCGAACLVMIGRHWGKQFSLNRLRDLANVGRDGASLRALAAAAESIGFVTRPVKASLDKLAEQPLPAVAHWEGKHFIVVYKITKHRVIVADPAIGQRSLSYKEFKKGWTGYALLLEPTAFLKVAEDDKTSLFRFFDLVKPHWKVLFEVFLASLLIQVFGLITPIFTQLILDKVIVQRSEVTLNAIGLGILIFGFFRIFVNGIRQYLLDHTANRVSVAMLVGFVRHTFRLPLSYFESRYVGDIVSRIQENQKIQRFLTGEALSIILDTLTIVVYLALMFWYSWQLSLMVLLVVPPFFILAFFATSVLQKISRETFTAATEENSYLIQALTGIRSIRSMAIEQTVRWHWEELLNKLIKKSFKAQIVGNRLQIAISTIDILINTGLLWFGAWQVIHDQLTIGQLIAFNMLVGNVLSPFQRLSVLWNQLQEVVISVERINDVLEASPEEDLVTQHRQSLGKLHGHIRFENVTFRYHKESEINILENLTFEIKAEQTVAVVGRSGSGKTTLSKLILGLYPPTDGKVMIDGHDVTRISLKTLRSQFGVVDQDTFLFGGTIRENISIAHPESNLEEIIEAAKLAGADEFIQRLPMGYETQIGEGGGLLSGGQRQRLAISRALLGNPRFILLDEATSSLDSESERIIQSNLKTLLKGRTSLIIAHRLSTIRNADLILVLDKGVLVESGSHEELINKKGHYYYLNQQQLAHTG
jgi:ATP-binding cassette, subfamily B, bacterial HlyB/CyaB